MKVERKPEACEGAGKKARQGRRREEGICPNTKSIIYVLIDWPYVL